MKTSDHKTTLRSAGLKVTHPRLRILEVLKSSKKPLSVQEILERFDEHVADQATVYRSAHALQRVGVLRRIDLRHGHVAFEMNDETHHHHHLICRECGKVADVEACVGDRIRAEVLKQAPEFVEITDHALEFYGVCRVCKRKNKNPL